MKKQLGLMMLALAGFCSTSLFAQETREGATVIRTGPGGEVQILSTETTTPAGGGTAVAPRMPTVTPEAAVEEAPRKARVVVTPAIFVQERRRRIDRELNERFGITDPGVIESPGFTSYLIDALVNVRKFDLLEREELRTVIKELDFGESDYVDMEKCQKIGNMVGADYIIIPEIRYLELDQEVKAVPYVGGNTVSLRCKLASNVRTVDVKTGKIISSHIDETEKRDRIRENRGDNMRIMVQDLIGKCFRETAIREAAKIVDVAYPIRVMSQDGDTVMLNRGEGALLQGEMLKVYAAGEVMVDPETKESLGYQEAYVGMIKVVEIGQKTSKGVIVEQVSAIDRLSICRRAEKISLDDPSLKKGSNNAPKID